MNPNQLILSSVFPVSESKILTVGLSPMKNFATRVKFTRKDESGGLSFSFDEFQIIWKFFANIVNSDYRYGTYKVSGTDYSISVTSMMTEKKLILIHKTSDFLHQHIVLSESNVQHNNMIRVESCIIECLDHCRLCEKQVSDHYSSLIKKLSNVYQKSADNDIKIKLARDFLDLSHPDETASKSFIFDCDLFAVQMNLFFIDLIYLDYLKTVYTR